MYYFITITRDVVIYARIPELWMVGGMVLSSLVVLLVGGFTFGRLKNKFAEMI